MKGVTFSTYFLYTKELLFNFSEILQIWQKKQDIRMKNCRNLKN
jgi:hypothetical protein